MHRFMIKGKDGYGFIDESGNVVIPARSDVCGDFRGGRARFRENGLLGYLDVDGSVAIPPRFSGASDFADNLAAAAVPGAGKTLRWGFIDPAGEWAIAPQYASAGEFAEGRAFVEVGPNLYRCIDPDGGILFELEARAVGPYSEGLAPFRPRGSSRTGFLDTSGSIAIEARYTAVRGFSEGRAAFVGSRSRSGYLDREGNVVIPAVHVIAGSFRNGLAPASAGAKDAAMYGFIDREGAIVISPQFRGLPYEFTEGLAAVAFPDDHGGFGDTGYIDPAGEMVIAPQFSYAQPFKNGLAAVRIRRGWRAWDLYIDRSGDPVWMADD